MPKYQHHDGFNMKPCQESQKGQYALQLQFSGIIFQLLKQMNLEKSMFKMYREGAFT